jgi:5-methyltetrahydrofolate--homocysteine methyltransferase
MSELLEKIADLVEKGKVDVNSPYPPDLKGQEGVDELTQKALQESLNPNDILQKGFMVGMNKIGDKFSEGKAFIPELLMSAKAMNAGMVHLKPFFESGEATHKGIMVLGTVLGDLHDIGKNIVRMVMEGNGWKVIDLGVDVKPEKFLEAVDENPDCILGMSALLTTTMMNMKDVVEVVRSKHPKTPIYVGGAPLSQEFNDKIQADGFFHDPHGLVKHLSQ